MFPAKRSGLVHARSNTSNAMMSATAATINATVDGDRKRSLMDSFFGLCVSVMFFFLWVIKWDIVKNQASIH